MKNTINNTSAIGYQLKNNLLLKVCEILLLFLLAVAVIKFILPLAGEDQVMRQAVIWVANIVMLTYIWVGLKLRGESWKDLGLGISGVSWKSGIKLVLWSVLVFLFAVAGFVLGSVIMANITGIPEQADMTGYTYLQGNTGMFLLTLTGVFIVSSLGEEIVYRAFLIDRIREMGIGTRSGKYLAVLISAIIFGLAHYSWGPMGMVQTGFMGLALGISYLALNRRLWILVLAHAYMDTILMLQLYFSAG